LKLSVRLYEPLSRHTAWRTGGKCDAFVVAHDAEGLSTVVRDCKSSRWPLTVLGSGTRTVARDGGVDGVVVRLGTSFSRMEREGNCWSVGAAVPVPALLAATAAAGFTGLEGLAYVPGSVGGLMALGWKGASWADCVDRVEVLRRYKLCELEPAEFSALGKPLVTRVVFRLSPGEPELVRRNIRELLRRSRANAGRSCSSWYSKLDRGKFRRTIERQNLDGARLRGAAVPSASPEMLVNLGGGTAQDLALLHRSVLARMRKEHDGKLTSVIRWMGKK
jgi:UDP-N-acetylmuramate dehydrogenase